MVANETNEINNPNATRFYCFGSILFPLWQRRGVEGGWQRNGWGVKECEEKRLTVLRLGIMKRLFINTCFEWREDAEMEVGLF
jgi:hypothetical protein